VVLVFRPADYETVFQAISMLKGRKLQLMRFEK
jgi:hypothetical protein